LDPSYNCFRDSEFSGIAECQACPALPPPYKRSPCPDEDPHPSNTPPPSPHRAHTVAIPSQSSTAVAPPPYRRTSSGEGRNQTLASSPSFSPPHDELSWPVPARSRSSGEPQPPPLFCVHRGPRLRWSMSHGLSPCGFLSKNKYEIRKSPPFCKETPWFLCNQAVVHEFSRRPPDFQK
jgi:hypothetical protein